MNQWPRFSEQITFSPCDMTCSSSIWWLQIMINDSLSPFIWSKSPLDPPLGLCSETRNTFLFPKLHFPFLEGLWSFLLIRADRGACVYADQIQSRIYESWAGFSCCLYHREIICWFHLVNKAAGWSLPFPNPAERLCGHNANVIM